MNAKPAAAIATFSIVPIILLAANLRPTITSVGPLVGAIRDTTGISLAAAGMLSSLPLLAFGGFAPLARFGQRYGLERTLVAALLLIAAGVLLRSSGSVEALFIGTACLAGGIAVGNILVPILIKRDYPQRVKGMTTIYAVALGLSASIGSGTAVPLANWLPGGWQTALSLWAIPAIIAAFVWLPSARRTAGGNAPPANSQSAPIWHSPLAWCVTAFMGLQSFNFYAVVAWFPTIFESHGRSATEAGFLISFFMIVALLVSAAMPLLLSRSKDQSKAAIGSGLALGLAVLGLFVFPAGAYLWMLLLGFGGGASLPLALTFIGLRTRDHHQAASLSMMSQSLGFLFAAIGPFALGILHDFGGSWAMPLLLLGALGFVQSVVGYVAGHNRIID